MNNITHSKTQTKVITHTRPAARVNVSLAYQKETHPMDSKDIRSTLDNIRASYSLVSLGIMGDCARIDSIKKSRYNGFRNMVTIRARTLLDPYKLPPHNVLWGGCV